jgi:hypothetical protein
VHFFKYALSFEMFHFSGEGKTAKRALIQKFWNWPIRKFIENQSELREKLGTLFSWNFLLFFDFLEEMEDFKAFGVSQWVLVNFLIEYEKNWTFCPHKKCQLMSNVGYLCISILCKHQFVKVWYRFKFFFLWCLDAYQKI